ILHESKSQSKTRNGTDHIPAPKMDSGNDKKAKDIQQPKQLHVFASVSKRQRIVKGIVQPLSRIVKRIKGVGWLLPNRRNSRTWKNQLSGNNGPIVAQEPRHIFERINSHFSSLGPHEARVGICRHNGSNASIIKRHFPNLGIKRSLTSLGRGFVKRPPSLNHPPRLVPNGFDVLAMPNGLIEQITLAIKPFPQFARNEEAETAAAPFSLHFSRKCIGFVDG